MEITEYGKRRKIEKGDCQRNQGKGGGNNGKSEERARESTLTTDWKPFLIDVGNLFESLVFQDT